MSKLSHKLIIGFIAGLSINIASAADFPYGEVTVDAAFKKVPNAPVYYFQGQSGVPSAANQGHTSNAGFVVTSEGVVVYDTLGTTALGYEMIKKIHSVTKQPITDVIVGHYHADHIYGTAAFRKYTTATIWGSEHANEYLDSDTADTRLVQRKEALFPWVPDDLQLQKPDKLIGDKLVLKKGDITLSFYYVGTAHSPSDLIMSVDEYGVVFTGDLLFGGRLPYLADPAINSKNWLQGLQTIQALKPTPRFLIPGHGTASSDGKALIDFTVTYISYLRKAMGNAVEDLEEFAEAYEATDWSQYKDVPTFDASNRGNAKQIYLEVTEELLE